MKTPNAQTATPQTDAKQFRAETVSSAAIVVWADDMRDLERELIGLRQQLAASEAPRRDGKRPEWTDILERAQEIVCNKPTWKRFIDGTPLSNDIAVWMADFAITINKEGKA